MSYWILCLFPDMDTTPIRPMYELQWWSQDKDHLKAWQKGKASCRMKGEKIHFDRV